MSEQFPKLSAIIITKNEEDNIARAAKGVQFVDEIIVVDAESKDETVRIAQSLGAKTFVRPWPGYGPQKNFGAAKAKGDWLLFIDADEEITPKLAEEIKAVILNPVKDFYWLKIVTVFLKKPLRNLFGHNPRLFKKSAGSWTRYHVHEQVQTNFGDVIRLGDDKSAVLKHPLLHHSHKTIQDYLSRMAEYTTLDAQQMAKTGKHRSGRPVKPSWLLPFYLSSRQLVKMLFYKKGIFDGSAGWTWSALSAYYEWTMAKKYLALQK